MIANALRGEVDLELDGQAFGLRPSYEAVLAAETGTGKSVQALAVAADAGALTLGEAAKIATLFIRAWGKSSGAAVPDRPEEELTGDEIDRRGAARAAGGVSEKRVGALIYEYGLMKVQPRLALVLARAASGGCTQQGEAKPAAGTTTIPETPAAGSPESPSPRSGRRRKSSGKAPATNSGPRSKSTKK